MNTTIRNNWKSNLYLDAIGSSSLIATVAGVLLFVALTALTEVATPNSQVDDACPASRSAAIDYTDQRPGAILQVNRTDCA